MSLRGNIGDVVETGRSCGVFSLEWRIPDFSSLSCDGGDFYHNPEVFGACDLPWFFRLYPNGISRNPPSQWVSLFLIRLDEGPPKTLGVTVGIRGAEGVENRKERLQEFSYDDDACCWRRFCKISDLRERETGLMLGNVLIITLDMKSVVPSVARGIEKLSEDIGKLLVDRDNADVTVQVGDVECKVHKLILSVRSPVLLAMLKPETAERESNRICIRDCEPDIFEEFLLYLYRGSVQSLTEQNVFGLYRVADRYLADDLKSQCLQHIRDTLSVRTVCETVKLALEHGESGLLKLAIDFAKENFPSVITSVQWQDFIREYPMEANEILIKYFGPRS